MGTVCALYFEASPARRRASHYGPIIDAVPAASISCAGLYSKRVES